MLLVKVEIWPGGSETHAREIGRVKIGNLSDLADVSDYMVIAYEGDTVVAESTVRRHRRAQGFWPLVARSLTLVSDARERARAIVKHV